MQIILYKIRTLYILITFLKDSFSFLSSSIPSLIASLSENLWITLPLNRRSNQRATDQTSELYIFLPTGSIFIPQRAINQTTELYIFMLTGSIFIPWRQRRWIILKRKGKKAIILIWLLYHLLLLRIKCLSLLFDPDKYMLWSNIFSLWNFQTSLMFILKSWKLEG